jgi:DNA-binding transcriptional MerR regulator
MTIVTRHTYDTTGSAARRIGVSGVTILRWAAAGRLPYIVAADGTRLYDPRDVDRLVRVRGESASQGTV